MTIATITVASHHFVVSRASLGVKVACAEFSRSLIQYVKKFVGRGRPLQEVPDRCYAASTTSRSEFRYHINHLETFKKILHRHNLDAPGAIEWKVADGYLADPMYLETRPGFFPDPLQEEAIEYITSEHSEIRNKVVIMQPGAGKTFTAMYAAAKLRLRMVIMVEPKYIKQWLKAFDENCVINKKRIAVIQGSDSLKSLLDMAAEGDLPYDAIIVSTITFRMYIDAYEFHGSGTALLNAEGYAAPPHLFFQHIRAGLRVIDEVHENFHLMFKIDLYTNVVYSVSLSATLFHDDRFLDGMMRVAYPPTQRFDKGGFKKYVTAYSLHYSLRRPNEIRTLQKGMGSYSHVEFEKSIMKSKEKTAAYFGMVRDSLLYTYDLKYRPGDRCLIYFATIEMCTLFTNYITPIYPHIEVRRYVSTLDPFENLMNADMSMSTLKAAGTGKDIAQLTTVILTVAINSSPSNLQGFGRLRDLNRKDPTLGREMFFVYFVADDIIKHVDYHQRKKELLATRALKYEPRYYGTLI
jgi:hypothetical protein